MKFLDDGELPVHQEEEISEQHERSVKKRPLLRETGGSSGAHYRGQLGSLVGVLMSL
jgi:hypothetical protein